MLNKLKPNANKNSKWKLMFTLLVVCLFLTACHTETINYYTGTVESDRYTAMTSLSGEVVAVYVEEGDQVKQGELLALIDTSALEIEKKRLESVLAGSEADLAQILKGAREEEVNQIRQQIEQQKDQIAILQDQLNHTFADYDTIKSLYDSGAATKNELDDAELLKMNAISKRDQAKSQKALLEENLNLVLQGATEEEVLSAQSRVDSAKWAVESVVDKMSNAQIRANHDGIIETIYFNLGEEYPMMSKFADITDAETLKVRIFVEELNLHKVAVGSEVTLKVDYDESLKLKGIVEFMSSEGEFTPKNLESKENRQEVVYETRVRINNTDGKLRPGMLIDIYLGDDIND